MKRIKKIFIFIKKYYISIVIAILIILLIIIPFILSKLLSNSNNSLDDYYGSMLGSIIAFCGVVLSLYFSKTEVRKEKKDDLLNSLHVNDYGFLNKIISMSFSLNNTCINTSHYIDSEFQDDFISAVEKHGVHLSAKEQLSNVVNELKYIIHKINSYRYSTISHLEQITMDKFFSNNKFNNNLNKNLQYYDSYVKELYKSYRNLNSYLEDYNLGRIPKVYKYSRDVKKSTKYLNLVGSEINKIGDLISNQLNIVKSDIIKSIINN